MFSRVSSAELVGTSFISVAPTEFPPCVNRSDFKTSCSNSKSSLQPSIQLICVFCLFYFFACRSFLVLVCLMFWTLCATCLVVDLFISFVPISLCLNSRTGLRRVSGTIWTASNRLKTRSRETTSWTASISMTLSHLVAFICLNQYFYVFLGSFAFVNYFTVTTLFCCVLGLSPYVFEVTHGFEFDQNY